MSSFHWSGLDTKCRSTLTAVAFSFNSIKVWFTLEVIAASSKRDPAYSSFSSSFFAKVLGSRIVSRVCWLSSSKKIRGGCLSSGTETVVEIRVGLLKLKVKRVKFALPASKSTAASSYTASSGGSGKG